MTEFREMNPEGNKLRLSQRIIDISDDTLSIEVHAESRARRASQDDAFSAERFRSVALAASEKRRKSERFWNTIVSSVNRSGFEIPEGKTPIILDVACGSCEEGPVLKAYFSGGDYITDVRKSESRLIGIDNSEGAIERAKANNSKERYKDGRFFTETNPSDQFLVADATRLSELKEVPEADFILIRHPRIIPGMSSDKESEDLHAWVRIFQESLKKLSPEGILITTFYIRGEYEKFKKAVVGELDAEIAVDDNAPNPHSNPQLEMDDSTYDRFVVVLRKKK